ncbi:TadE/TadG family type IV pilus assembly protein [Metapseudomonas furukawaii]
MNARSMRGVFVVEFAVIGLLLFVLLFGVLEMGRLFFTANALNEAARRGARLAAVCDIQDVHILHRAIFNEAGETGESSLIGNLQPSQLVLAYFDAEGEAVSSPNDLTSPTGFRAIRFVQLRVEGFTFDLLIPTFSGTITLPVFQSTLPRESLGRHAEGPQGSDKPSLPGVTPC